jgi:pre-mRNA-splicing factor CWC22
MLFATRQSKWQGYEAISTDLDLVEDEDKVVHDLELLVNPKDVDIEEGLDIFGHDPRYEEHENAYLRLRSEILGEAEANNTSTTTHDDDPNSDDD